VCVCSASTCMKYNALANEVNSVLFIIIAMMLFTSAKQCGLNRQLNHG